MRRVVGFGRDLYRSIVDDRVTGLAAEVAFFGVLSIFPGMLMVAAALGYLEVFVGRDLAERAQEQIIGFLDLILTEQATEAIGEVEGLFAEGRPGVLTVATLGALWALARGFGATIRSLNLAFGVKEKRSWIRLRLLSLGLSLAGVFVAAVSLAMIVSGPLLGRGQEAADWLGAGGAYALIWAWVRWPVGFILMVSGAATVYHVAPYRGRGRWRDDVPGAVVAAVLWLVVSLGFSLYLRVAPGANAVLGALGGGLILLVWLYLLSIALLVGGEVNATIVARRSDDASSIGRA